MGCGIDEKKCADLLFFHCGGNCFADADYVRVLYDVVRFSSAGCLCGGFSDRWQSAACCKYSNPLLLLYPPNRAGNAGSGDYFVYLYVP